MHRCEIVQNLRGGIGGAVIHGNNFDMGIIDRRQTRKGRRELLLLIARGKKQRDVRTIFIARGWKVLDPWQTYGAVRDAQSMENPENRDNGKEKQLAEVNGQVHENWCAEEPRVILARDGEEPGDHRRGTCWP